MRPRAVVASLDYWTSPAKLGGHHIALGLVNRGWDVAYVSWPISPLHLLSRRWGPLRERFRIYRHGGVADAGGSLWAYVPGALAAPYNRPFLRSPWLHRNWPLLTFPRVVQTLGARGFGTVDLFYLDVPIHLRLLESIDARHSVLRIPDRLSGFSHLAPAMQALEREAASTVDLVAYSARTLEPHVRELGAKRMLHLPNGVDFAQFASESATVPKDLEGIPRPIALYVGAMREWFDFSCINDLAAARPDISFVLIGPPELARKRLTPRPNVRLLGSRPHASLPGYMRNADIGLIPFDVIGHSSLVDSVHPLKLYEYLASGLPVVATRWEEIERLDSPAVLCRTPQEFVAAMESILSRPSNTEAGVDFARAADWSARVRELLAAFEKEV